MSPRLRSWLFSPATWLISRKALNTPPTVSGGGGNMVRWLARAAQATRPRSPHSP